MWTNTGGNFQKAPVGAHMARLISILDLGTQHGEYQGKPTVNRQNVLTWELPEELQDDGTPFTISKFYNISFGEKSTLTRDLTSWLGKTPTPPFDPKVLLGKDCQIVVTQKEGSDKVNVSSVIGLPKGQKITKETHNPIVFFSLDDFDEDVFEGISTFFKGKIQGSPEYAAIMSGGADTEVDDEPIPF